jgi:D-alanyl-D-alanine dipeptidase
MMRKLLKLFALIYIIFTFIACESTAENKNDPRNPYNLDLVSDISVYKTNITQNPDNELINLENFISSIKLDIRYATTNNFTGKIVYPEVKAFARKPVAESLKKVQEFLENKGLGLMIYDAYRPYSISLKFYEIYPDTNFVAAPWLGSRHNRGCAVDISLYNLKDGKQLSMPSEYDDFSEKAHPDYSNLTDSVIANRTMLINIMKEYGFTVYPTEWWHYDFKGWNNFKLMDIQFKDLEN